MAEIGSLEDAVERALETLPAALRALDAPEDDIKGKQAEPLVFDDEEDTSPAPTAPVEPKESQPPRVYTPFGDHEVKPIDHDDIVVVGNDRPTMERGSAYVFIGAAGAGKTTFIGHLLASIAIGRGFMGFQPKRHLRVLVIQNENSEGDLANIEQGFLQSCSADERALLAANYVTDSGFKPRHEPTGAFFKIVRDGIERHKADIVYIDSALHYVGGDNNSAADVGDFLRFGLDPVLKETGCVGIISTHPPKPQQNASFNPWSLMYAAAGSAEWANYPRNVFTLFWASEDKLTIRIDAAKNSARCPWEDGYAIVKKSGTYDLPSWEMASEDEAEEADKFLGQLGSGDKKPGRKSGVTDKQIIGVVRMTEGERTALQAERIAKLFDITVSTVKNRLSKLSGSGLKLGENGYLIDSSH